MKNLKNLSFFICPNFLRFFNVSMTFEFLSIFHDFPGKFIFPGFSMIFHDRGNPVRRQTQSPVTEKLHSGKFFFHGVKKYVERWWSITNKTGQYLHSKVKKLGSFFNCCKARCSFFVEADLLRFLLCIVETTFPRIGSASLGGMPRNPSSTEARMSFIGTSLGTTAKFKPRPNTWTWSAVKVFWDRLTTHLLEGFELFFCCGEFVFSKDFALLSRLGRDFETDSAETSYTNLFQAYS